MRQATRNNFRNSKRMTDMMVMATVLDREESHGNLNSYFGGIHGRMNRLNGLNALAARNIALGIFDPSNINYISNLYPNTYNQVTNEIAAKQSDPDFVQYNLRNAGLKGPSGFHSDTNLISVLATRSVFEKQFTDPDMKPISQILKDSKPSLEGLEEMSQSDPVRSMHLLSMHANTIGSGAVAGNHRNYSAKNQVQNLTENKTFSSFIGNILEKSAAFMRSIGISTENIRGAFSGISDRVGELYGKLTESASGIMKNVAVGVLSVSVLAGSFAQAAPQADVNQVSNNNIAVQMIESNGANQSNLSLVSNYLNSAKTAFEVTSQSDLAGVNSLSYDSIKSEVGNDYIGTYTVKEGASNNLEDLARQYIADVSSALSSDGTAPRSYDLSDFSDAEVGSLLYGVMENAANSAGADINDPMAVGQSYTFNGTDQIRDFAVGTYMMDNPHEHFEMTAQSSYPSEIQAVKGQHATMGDMARDYIQSTINNLHNDGKIEGADNIRDFNQADMGALVGNIVDQIGASPSDPVAPGSVVKFDSGSTIHSWVSGVDMREAVSPSHDAVNMNLSQSFVEGVGNNYSASFIPKHGSNHSIKDATINYINQVSQSLHNDGSVGQAYDARDFSGSEIGSLIASVSAQASMSAGGTVDGMMKPGAQYNFNSTNLVKDFMKGTYMMDNPGEHFSETSGSSYPLQIQVSDGQHMTAGDMARDYIQNTLNSLHKDGKIESTDDIRDFNQADMSSLVYSVISQTPGLKDMKPSDAVSPGSSVKFDSGSMVHSWVNGVDMREDIAIDNSHQQSNEAPSLSGTNDFSSLSDTNDFSAERGNQRSNRYDNESQMSI